MAGDSDKSRDDKATEKPSIGFTLPFADSAPASPIEMMTAATAAGMALSAQFASAFFGMMQAAMEASGKPAAGTAAKAASPETPAAAQSQPSETGAEPAKATPVAVEPEAVPVKADTRKVEKPTKVTKPVKVVKLAKAETSAKPAKSAKSAAAAALVVPAKRGRPAKVVSPASVDKPAEAAKPAKRGRPLKIKAPVEAEAQPAAAVAAEPKAQQKPRRSAKATDDLTKISGIGPKLESLLHGMDVKSYRDIAAWSETDVEHFDQELQLDGRIAKDNWIAQAKTLLR